MLDFLPAISALMERHWLFVATVIILNIVGQIMDKRVFTRDRALHSTRFAIARDTMAIHPILAGMVLGIVFARRPTLGTFISSIMYYGFAGALSSVAHKVIEMVARARGVTPIILPGLSDRPPAQSPTRAEEDAPTEPGRKTGRPAP